MHQEQCLRPPDAIFILDDATQIKDKIRDLNLVEFKTRTRASFFEQVGVHREACEV